MNCENCKCFYSCQYMQDRFGTKECAVGRKIFVDRNHKRELQERERLIKGM